MHFQSAKMTQMSKRTLWSTKVSLLIETKLKCFKTVRIQIKTFKLQGPNQKLSEFIGTRSNLNYTDR